MAVGKDDDLAAVGRKRRSWKRDEKRQIVEESLQDWASIAEVARRHDFYAYLLFTWRRQLGMESIETSDLTRILPVTITAGGDGGHRAAAAYTLIEPCKITTSIRKHGSLTPDPASHPAKQSRLPASLELEGAEP